MCLRYYKAVVFVWVVVIIETLRFKEEEDYERSFFFHVFSKNRQPGKLHCAFDSQENQVLLSLLKEVKPSPD